LKGTRNEKILCPCALIKQLMEVSPRGWKRACSFVLESGGSILVRPQIRARNLHNVLSLQKLDHNRCPPQDG
jgi:hypothetical protein